MLVVTLSALFLLCVDASGSYKVHTKRKVLAPLTEPFGFSTGGHVTIGISNFRLHAPNAEAVDAGFVLRRFPNEANYTEEIALILNDENACVFDKEERDDALDGFDTVDDGIRSAEDGIELLMSSQYRDLSYTFKRGEEGLYFLTYQVCPYIPGTKSSFTIDYHYCNKDILGREVFLSSGELGLPLIYFFFAVSYFLCFLFWWQNIRDIQKGGSGFFSKQQPGRPTVLAIHQFMTLVVALKFATVLSESIRYHFVKGAETAEFWTFMYSVIDFLRGMFLFTVMLLIGSGWGTIKSFLSTREKYTILFVLALQTVDHIALAVLSNEIEGEQGFRGWNAVLHLVDIICCCMVLLPIVWRVNALESELNSASSDDEIVVPEDDQLDDTEKEQIVDKLRLFRTFYLVVVGFIYSTRIIVYLFSKMLDYRHTWMKYAVVEVFTLAFYVTVGILFRPVPDTYQTVETRDSNLETELPVVRKV